MVLAVVMTNEDMESLRAADAERKAVSRARRFAKTRGYAVEAYVAEVDLSEETWEVTFRSNAVKPAPGDFFTVELDRKTGRVQRLIPGK